MDAGQAFTLTAVYSDPGLLDTHTAVIAWSEGPSETLELEAGQSSFDFSHAYAATGAYTVTVTLQDDDGGLAVQTFTVTVEAVIPPLTHIWLPIIQRAP